MGNGHQSKQMERYEILKADAAYQVRHNLLFKMHIIPVSFREEKRVILELIAGECKESFEAALRMLKTRYKYCPARDPLESILKEYY